MNAEQIRKLADNAPVDGVCDCIRCRTLRACADVVEAAEAYHAEGTGVASDVLKALAKLEALKC